MITLWKMLGKFVDQQRSGRDLLQRSSVEISYRHLAQIALQPYKGILHSSSYGEPVKKILHTIFYTDLHKWSLQNLTWYLSFMFLAALFGISCRDSIGVFWFVKNGIASSWMIIHNLYVQTVQCNPGTSHPPTRVWQPVLICWVRLPIMGKHQNPLVYVENNVPYRMTTFCV